MKDLEMDDAKLHRRRRRIWAIISPAIDVAAGDKAKPRGAEAGGETVGYRLDRP